MSAHSLDTLAIAGKLKAAGFSDLQAEAMTFVLRDAREADASTAATKADLQAIRVEIKADLQAIRAETKADLQAIRAETKAEFQAVRAELQNLGTELRAEMQSHRQETKADIQALDLRLEAKIEAGKADTIKWVISAIGFQTIVLVGAVVAMSRMFQP